jgi:hypothetical protein
MVSISQMAAALSRRAHVFPDIVVVTLDAITEARLLLVGTSAPKAELIALMQVIQLVAGVLCQAVPCRN